MPTSDWVAGRKCTGTALGGAQNLPRRVWAAARRTWSAPGRCPRSAQGPCELQLIPCTLESSWAVHGRTALLSSGDGDTGTHARPSVRHSADTPGQRGCGCFLTPQQRGLGWVGAPRPRLTAAPEAQDFGSGHIVFLKPQT